MMLPVKGNKIQKGGYTQARLTDGSYWFQCSKCDYAHSSEMEMISHVASQHRELTK